MQNIKIKEISETENPKKVLNIAEKILNFNEQQKSKGLKTLTPKHLLQRLPIALALIKADNASKNLLNKVRQVIYL